MNITKNFKNLVIGNFRRSIVNNYYGFKSKKSINRYLISHPIKKLQIGCGPNILADWLNTDVIPSNNVVFVDASKQLPFKDRCFNYVFCEHLIEHLDYGKGTNLIRECLRVLVPGGKLRISTPDLNFLINLYNQDKSDLQKRYIKWSIDTFSNHIGIYNEVIVINGFFRYWGHQFIYNFELLKHILISQGFIEIQRQNVGQSTDFNLANLERHNLSIPDDFNRLETFVIEAVKPQR
jgi:predicted SAM-dependent methyltransferase